MVRSNPKHLLFLSIFWQDISRSHKELGIGFSPIVLLPAAYSKWRKKEKKRLLHNR